MRFWDPHREKLAGRRGSFKGATALKEVCSYIDQQVASVSGQDYRLVSLHPAKEFSDSDMTKSLAELGLQSQTSLRIRHKQVSTGLVCTAFNLFGFIFLHVVLLHGQDQDISFQQLLLVTSAGPL